MDDVLEGFLWIFFYFFLFLLGVYAGYIKNPNRKSDLIISIAKVYGE